MGAFAGKHKRIDNESNGKQQKRTFRFSTAHRRGGQNKASSSTTLYDLPLEMLDIILQKSYLHWILNSSTKQRDEEVIRSLISVDVCFYRRITRQRFKKAIWRYLKDFYGKTKKRAAIIRNNRNYLLENIQPSNGLIASLLSFNCITEHQSHFIQRQRSKREKNSELLYIVEHFDEAEFSNFVKCLRQNNQNTVARIIENGGGVIKIEVQTSGAKCTTSMDSQLIHQSNEDLQNITKQTSHQTDKLMSQLREEGIEILNSYLDRQTVVVWIWCRSQAALQYIQKLYESNQLRDVFFEYIQPSTSKVINIDRNQFKKTIVVCPISIYFTHRIAVGRNELVRGVNKLRNEIYVLLQPSSPTSPTVIRVFEDRYPFRFRKKIEITEIRIPVDIGSSEKENCLYVTDCMGNCVWKISKKERGEKHKIIKWLTTDFQPRTLSISSDGQLSMLNDSSPVLMIYGSAAELIRRIRLPSYIEITRHAVKTSIGTFIILHGCEKNDEDGERRTWVWDITEVTNDGEMVIRYFIPLSETQKLNDPSYLSLDSDDRVFVTDFGNERVILLDSDLKWNRFFVQQKK